MAAIGPHLGAKMVGFGPHCRGDVAGVYNPDVKQIAVAVDAW